MATTFFWTIAQMDCVPKAGDLPDYVVTVHWRYGITDGTISTDIYGAQAFSADPEQPNFTPYEDLTFDQVVGWLEGVLDVPAMQASLTQAYDNLINPPIVVLPLPWENGN